jgi:hypothetical protein
MYMSVWIEVCWSERDVLRTLAAGVDRIGIVQISDFVLGTRSTPNRVLVFDYIVGPVPVQTEEMRCQRRLTRRLRPTEF